MVKIFFSKDDSCFLAPVSGLFQSSAPPSHALESDAATSIFRHAKDLGIMGVLCTARDCRAGSF